jgi:hypothetical protein
MPGTALNERRYHGISALLLRTQTRGDIMTETTSNAQKYIYRIVLMFSGDTQRAFEHYQNSIYGESHERFEGETDQEWVERCAEQDFLDGYDACLFPAQYRAAIESAPCEAEQSKLLITISAKTE